MAETTPYFESITSARAIADYDEKTALEGGQLLSIESDADQQEQDVFIYIQENFSVFLQHLRLLRSRDRELLLAYYCLHKTQRQLAALVGSTQTVISFRIRMLVKVVCACMVFEGIPSEGQIAEVLEAVGLERISLRHRDDHPESNTYSLSAIITMYAQTNSFALVAAKFRVHRPAVRKTMRHASEQLIASTNDKHQLIGWWIHYLIDKANPISTGLAKREQKKIVDIVRSDPEEVGQFRVTITEDNADDLMDAVFAAHGNL